MRTFILALFVAFAFSQTTQICQQNSDCNTYGTAQKMLCDLTKTPAVCAERESFAFKTTNLKPGVCSSSINHGSTNPTCGAYSSAGCTIDLADSAYFKCTGSSLDIVSRKCVADVKNGTWSTEGGVCSTDPLQRSYCNVGLQCIQRVCRKQLQLGENCLGTSIDCAPYTTCNGDFCAISASVPPQGPCKSDGVCISGQCLHGFCTEKRSFPCYSNTNCPSGVCYIQSGKSSGFCTSGLSKATSQLNLCRWLFCSSSSKLNLESDCTSCTDEYINQVCETNCILAEDQRKVTDGFIYDCAAKTRTKQNQVCGYKAAVINCPAVPASDAITQGISMIVALVAILSIFA